MFYPDYQHAEPFAKMLPFRTRWRSLRVPLLVAAAVVAACATLVAALPKAVATTPPGTPPALTVTVAAARQVTWPAVLDATGTIVPWQEAIVGSQAAGLRLIEVSVNVGDRVKRGQVLARYDDTGLRAEAAQLRAATAQARATAAQANANEQRALALRGSGGISDQEVQQYVTQAETARAQVEIAQAQLEAKQVQLRYANVVAPDDGVISARSASLGAVGASSQELFRLIRQQRLEWRGEVTAMQLANIVEGQRVELSLPDGGSATARVRQTAPALDERSRMGMVYADITRPESTRAGMYAAGRIVLAQRPAMVVPAASVVIRDGRSYVYKVQEERGVAHVAVQAVTVGRRQGGEVEIMEALREGERVVAQGAGLLNDGDVVRIARPAASAPLVSADLPARG
jgi:RND family efflux transporter MFP subunit